MAAKNPTLAPEKVRAVITTDWGSGYRPVSIRSIESYSIESNLDQDSDAFSLVIGDPRNIMSALLDRDAEIRVQLFGVGLDVSYLLTGIADDVDKSEDGRITITGRDNSAIATDTTAAAGMWREQKANAFIEKRARQLGVTTRFSLQPGPTKKTIKTDGSESEWELWYRLIRKEKQWLWFTSDGWLKSGELNYSGSPEYFFGTNPVHVSSQQINQWIPIERVAYKKTTQSRIGDVVVFYHNGGRVQSYSDADPLLEDWKKRPLKYVEDKHIHTKGQAKKAAWEEIFEGKVGALEIQVTVPDIGMIIRQNRVARLRIPELDLGGDWFVVGSRIIADESGFIQEVRLREKGYAISRRVPSDPETQNQPSDSPDDIAACQSLCDVIDRWCQYFINAAHQWRGNVAFDLFLAVLLAMCEQESHFQNIRQRGGPGNQAVEWFEWDGKSKDGVTSLQEWKTTFANNAGDGIVNSEFGVGPMQLTDRSLKIACDGWPDGKGKVDEFYGNRWLPEANIWHGARHLNGKAGAGGLREETLWEAVRAYNGSGPDAEAYREIIRRRVAQQWLPAVQLGIEPCRDSPDKPFSGKGIIIPTMHSTNHCTAGYVSFYAYDFMEPRGTEVYLEESAIFDKNWSHSAPYLRTWEPGYGGWTFQIVGQQTGRRYWITHLDETDPNRYRGGSIPAKGYIGRMTTDPQKAEWIGGSHVHVGSDTWPKPPPGSRDCPP